jgi:Ca2+-transporting ATPase
VPTDEESDLQGLSEEEAARRLTADGYNELPSAKPRSVFAIALGVVREPMFLLLVACAVLYLFLGDREEALMLASAVLVVMGITFYQERKTERTLEALRDLSSPRALVIRGGEQKRIAGREVVTGDLLVLAEGDRVAADGILLSGLNVAADESLLTGESVPVRKGTVAEAEAEERGMERPGGEDLPFVFAGTLVVQGRGVAVVKATGTHTEMGKIGKGLQAVERQATLLQQSTDRLVRIFSALGLSLCLVVVLVYGVARGTWLNGLLAGITMAISMIPEEFPVVLTIFLALGAWRIAQKNVLTRRVPAIETLGAATALCVDKTGTLTLNRMAVRRLSVNGTTRDVDEMSNDRIAPVPEPFAELVTFAVLASQPEPFDPMEKALHQLGAQVAPAIGASDGWRLVRQYALSPQLLAMTNVWKAPTQPHYTVAAKGAPEAIATLCRLEASQREALDRQVKALAGQGLRVLGVAQQILDEEEVLPDKQEGFAFTLLGLVGLADPVRPTVASSVQECYGAGVRVLMITGDYPGTARSIAREIGLDAPEEVLTGDELARMDAETLRQRVGAVNVFARVMPEQKLLLVNALKARGEVVAMTGDGVNDAPALRAAHIGIAMGKRGTDVAREAADLVLLDDDFSSIVRAIRLGRRIYTNIKNAMAYITAVHVPIAGLSLLPVLFGWPLILLPVHIVFLELVIDPACSVVFEAEPEEPDIMQRPPRDPKEPLFTRRRLLLSLLQGASVLGVVLSIFTIALRRGQGALDARAITYTTLIVANLGLILTNLSWSGTIAQTLRKPNHALWWVLGGVFGSLGMVLYVPLLRELFRFSFLHPIDLALCLGAGVVSIAWFEVFKVFRGRRAAPRHGGSGVDPEKNTRR